MDRTVDRITSYAMELSYEDLSQEVVARAKHLIIDTVGCALGAAPSPPAAIALSMASEVSSPTPATVMVGGQKSSPDVAAFANGVLIRYLDYNDTYMSRGVCHPSDMLAPVLACVEAAHGGGKDVVLGTVLGYEIMCRLMDSGAMQPEGGWDQSTYCIIGAAAVAAKLLGLDRDQMGHAISLAASSHLTLGQIRSGQLAYWKGCAAANASRNAVFCAMLAAKGMTGPNSVFEGPKGLMKATGISFQLPPFGGAARPFSVMTSRIKSYPAAYFAQSAIEAVLELRPMATTIDDIAEMRLQTSPWGHHFMGSDQSRWKPDTRESADHSLPFVMAVALMEGGLELRHYEQEYFRKPQVLALMERIVVSVGEESRQAWPKETLSIVEMVTKSGEVHSSKVAYHLGHFQRPMSDADQERKFRPMAQDYARLPKEQVDGLLERLRELERVQEIGEVLALTIMP